MNDVEELDWFDLLKAEVQTQLAEKKENTAKRKIMLEEANKTLWEGEEWLLKKCLSHLKAAKDEIEKANVKMETIYEIRRRENESADECKH